jgi:hypothetical protein
MVHLIPATLDPAAEEGSAAMPFLDGFAQAEPSSSA